MSNRSRDEEVGYFLRKVLPIIMVIAILLAGTAGLKKIAHDAGENAAESASKTAAGLVQDKLVKFQIQTAKTNYNNILSACVRANTLRPVVYKNTKISVIQSESINDPSSTTDVFRDNLRLLKSAKGFNPKTGKIRCLKVIRVPKILLKYHDLADLDK